MKKIDKYSYNCGVMDCFSEMVKASLKPMALAHPSHDKDERDQYIEHADNLSQKYQIKYYLDDNPLLSDLFPLSQNKDTYNIIFYKKDETISEYITLKELKNKAIKDQRYNEYRFEIAYRFGKLLGYSDNCINEYIKNNHEKE